MVTTRSQEAGTKPVGAPPGDEPELVVRPPRRVGELVVTLVMIAVAVAVVASIATNPRFGWDVIGSYLFDPAVLRGLGTTLLLTVESTVLGLVLGVVVAVMRLSPIPALAVPAWLFAQFFRGTPLLVQIIFWYNLAALYPRVGLVVPGAGTLFDLDVNQLIAPLTAGLLALGLNEGAYMSEIIRAGIIGVDRGQADAARSLGMRPGQVLARVVMPQAMRTILPPMGNEIIGLLKGTSLVSVIAVSELLFSVQAIYSQNLQTIPLLIVASIWYLVVTAIMSVGQFQLERHFGRGAAQGAAPTLRGTFMASLTRFHAPLPAVGARR